MARKVGFGVSGACERRAGQVLASDGGGQNDAESARSFRWVLIGFLAVWLGGWTTGIVFVFRAFVAQATQDPFGRAFLIFWLIFAVAGWVFVVRVILKLLRGVPLSAANPD